MFEFLENGIRFCTVVKIFEIFTHLLNLIFTENARNFKMSCIVTIAVKLTHAKPKSSEAYLTR